MKVTYVPVLQILRELYAQPRDTARFRRYIATLTGGGDERHAAYRRGQSMANEHALASIDELLGLGDEEIGAETTREAERRLRNVQRVEVKTSIVLADDVGGGWTNRYTTEAMVRSPARGALKRPFATALAWTSELPTADGLRQEVLAAIYRVAYQQRFGLPVTLRDRLRHEGLAGAFAGMRPSLADAELRRARGIIAGLGDAPPYPTTFAALYGDAAAAELGYQPLGLPPRAGFDVALLPANDPLRAIMLEP